MSSFADNFNQYFGSVISEVQIGLGPAGIIFSLRGERGDEGERLNGLI